MKSICQKLKIRFIVFEELVRLFVGKGDRFGFKSVTIVGYDLNMVKFRS
jgi:hypothetical protein